MVLKFIFHSMVTNFVKPVYFQFKIRKTKIISKWLDFLRLGRDDFK